MATEYIHPRMYKWFNEWQTHPTKMGVSDEFVYRYVQKYREEGYFLHPTSKNLTEMKWTFFFISFFRKITDAGKDYYEWIVSKLGEPPYMGINHLMVADILNNFRNPNLPFDKRNYTYHDSIMFLTSDKPPKYPPMGLERRIVVINWMWDSSFTLK